MAIILATIALAISTRADEPRLDLLKKVGIDQHLGAQLSPDLLFRDEGGRDVRLGDYFKGRPVILTLVYYGCPMLCTTVLNELNVSLNVMPTNIGQQFDVLTVSFNPAEKPELARRKKEHYLRQYGRPHAEEGWHFLTGDEASIRKLTETVGFRFVADPLPDPLHPGQQQYIHAGGIIILTPSGKVSRYFYGINYAPKDLRLALVEASQEKSSSLGNAVLLFCFQYDPHTGKYTLAVLNLLKAGALVSIALVGLFLFHTIHRERRMISTGGSALADGISLQPNALRSPSLPSAKAHPTNPGCP